MNNKVFISSIAFALAAAQLYAGTIIGAVEGKSGRIAHAVIYVTDAKGSFSAPSEHAKVDQKDKEFVPAVIAVQKGATVDFDNSDPFFHNVFSSSHSKTFNVSQTKKGDTSAVTFDKVGIVPIRCHIHANMKGYIVVCPNPFFATSNGKGLFKINDIPAGTYTLKVWTASGAATTQTVTVPATGEAKVIFKV